MAGNNFLDIMMHQRFTGHQSCVLLCTETTLSNHPVIHPKPSCDVHLLRSLCINQQKVKKLASDSQLTSESKKPGQIVVIYHNCDLSRIFWLRHYWLFKFWQTMFKCSFCVFLVLLLLYPTSNSLLFFWPKVPDLGQRRL